MIAILRGLRFLLALFRDARGVTLYETAAVVAMSTIVASVAVPMALDRIEDAKEAKAANEVLTIFNGMMRFFEHTGRWPGEEQIGAFGSSGLCFLQTGTPTTATNPTFGTPLPDSLNIGFFDATVFIGRSCLDVSPTTTLNINDYLARRPSVVEFPDWQGPYMEPITGDPWDRAYLINVLPLIFGGEVIVQNSAGLSETVPVLGNGWVLSVGGDRLLQTTLRRDTVAGDDIGKNMTRRGLAVAGR